MTGRSDRRRGRRCGLDFHDATRANPCLRAGARAMTDALAALLESLDLVATGDDGFEARCVERARPRVFGGELLAQRIRAASRTAGGRVRPAPHVCFPLA